MQTISLWQPFATLLVLGHKRYETRGYPPPKKTLNVRTGIAATKGINKSQLEAFNEPNFRKHYDALGLPDLKDLPTAGVLGTGVIVSATPIDQEFVNSLSRAEYYFGWYAKGRWAWLYEDVQPFDQIIPASGKQGFWEWPGGA